MDHLSTMQFYLFSLDPKLANLNVTYGLILAPSLRPMFAARAYEMQCAEKYAFLMWINLFPITS